VDRSDAEKSRENGLGRHRRRPLAQSNGQATILEASFEDGRHHRGSFAQRRSAARLAAEAEEAGTRSTAHPVYCEMAARTK